MGQAHAITTPTTPTGTRQAFGTSRAFPNVRPGSTNQLLLPCSAARAITDRRAPERLGNWANLRLCLVFTCRAVSVYDCGCPCPCFATESPSCQLDLSSRHRPRDTLPFDDETLTCTSKRSIFDLYCLAKPNLDPDATNNGGPLNCMRTPTNPSPPPGDSRLYAAFKQPIMFLIVSRVTPSQPRSA